MIRKEFDMLELLAPGGSYEGLTAAVNAGADAVYMGGKKFGARAYAQNPEERELLDALDYCHLHGRKLYLTVNTLLKETEVERELYDYLLPVYEHGLDAVLVQDFGVFRFIRKHFPDLPLHASTQMTITGPDGARMLKRMGAERIVPSRELSLQEIRRIHGEVDIEIECFVHGALCYCYSGQCLMSSMIGGRSGNRGRCAQPCRLPYELYCGEQKRSRENQKYLLSLKDICTLQSLPDLIEAGVCSFKMEGRMKRPEYAAGVTQVYRKYLDLYTREGKKGYKIDPEDERMLMDLYNRGGFSGGYYETRNGKSMMSMERPNHQGTQAARVVGVQNGKLCLKALEPLWAKDVLEGESSGRGKTELTLKENVAAGKEFTLSAGPRMMKKGQVFSRVRCEKLLQELQEKYMKGVLQEKIKGKFILNQENPAILTVKWKNQSVTVTGEKAETAANRPVEEETIRRQLMKTGNTPFVFEELDIVIEDGLFYPMQSLNEMRRNALEQLREKILNRFSRNSKSCLEKTGESGDRETPLSVTAGKMEEVPALLASVETAEQLLAVSGDSAIAGVYLDCCMFLPVSRTQPLAMTFEEAVDLLHSGKKRCYLMLPMIWRDHVKNAFEHIFTPELLRKADGFLLRSSEQLEYFRQFFQESFEKKEMIADAGIYTYNKEARQFLEDWGIDRDTLPLEANRKELLQRGCEGSEMIVYGYLPLMVTAQCLVKNTSGCRKTPELLRLRDRKHADFPVRNQCAVCTNMIYNSVPLDLISAGKEISELHPASFRLSFTVEDKEETLRIVRAAKACLLRGEAAEKAVESGTKGHFKRGVE